MSANYTCLNGTYYLSDKAVLPADNRAFCYGDALFETIRAYGTEALFLEDHLERLLHGMKVLQMDIPKNYTLEFFQKQISKLLNKNRIYKAARIRLAVYRDSEGFYTPSDNKVSFLINSSPLLEEIYSLNKTGYRIGLFTEIKKPVSLLSNLKSANALLFVMAGIYRKKHDLDDCLILNEEGSIIESTSSNVFFLKGNALKTPALSEGCILGTMRKKILALSESLGYAVEEISKMGVDDLLLADEVFISNAIQGVRWVMGYGQRRYYHRLSARLIDGLNHMAKH